MKALVDTCVVIDALQDRKPFSENARKIFLAAASAQFDAYLTAKEVTDIYDLTHHALHSREKTEQIMTTLLSLFPVLDTCASDVEQAIVSPVTDYEDAVMVATAEREHLDCIVKRNIKDYKKSSISVYSPEEFLNCIQYKDPEDAG